MEKIRKDRRSAQPCISLTESLQTFSGYDSFQLQLNLENKVFRYFFFVSLYIALALSPLFAQLLIFLTFSCQTRTSPSVGPLDQAMEPHHICSPQDSPQIRPPHQTIRRVSDPTTD